VPEGFDVAKVLPFLIPLVVIQIALMVVALLDLLNRKRVKGGSKLVWGLVIVLVNTIGPIVYLLAGREEGPVDGD
jgi:hypothetical protein